jgi:hypothetical protein
MAKKKRVQFQFPTEVADPTKVDGISSIPEPAVPLVLTPLPPLLQTTPYHQLMEEQDRIQADLQKLVHQDSAVPPTTPETKSLPLGLKILQAAPLKGPIRGLRADSIVFDEAQDFQEGLPSPDPMRSISHFKILTWEGLKLTPKALSPESSDPSAPMP